MEVRRRVVLTVSYDEATGAVVTAVGVGTAHVTAKAGGKTGTAEFIVRARATAIELDKGLFELAKGTELELGAILLTADGGKRPIDDAVTWGSSVASIATVDETGLVAGIGVGEAVITATREGITAAQVVHVRDWTLESVEAEALDGTTLLFELSTPIAVTGTFTGGRTQDITSLFVLAAEEPPIEEMAEPIVTAEGAVVTAGTEEGTSTVTGTGLPGSVVADERFTIEFTVVDAPLTTLSLELPAVLAAGGDPGVATIIGTYGETSSLRRRRRSARRPKAWCRSTTLRRPWSR